MSSEEEVRAREGQDQVPSQEFLQRVMQSIQNIRHYTLRVVQNIALWRHQLLQVSLISSRNDPLQTGKMNQKI